METLSRFRIRTTAELLAEGWTKAKIAWERHKGKLFQVFHGVYADQEVTPEVVVQALLKVRPDAVFEKRTALELYSGQPLTFPIQARVSSNGLRLGAKDVVELRRSQLDSVNMCNGLPVASVADVVNSLLPKDPGEPILALLAPITEKFYAGRDGIERLQADLKNMGRGCKSRIRDFVDHNVVVGVDSPPEADLIRALRAAGFKVTPQLRLGKYRWDVGVKGLKVVIDVDSKQYHMNDEKAFVVDRWKANSGIMLGWIALRVTANCIRRHLKQIVELLKEIRRLKQVAPRKFPKVEIPPVWQWHEIYSSEWEYQPYYNDG